MVFEYNSYFMENGSNVPLEEYDDDDAFYISVEELMSWIA